MDYKIELHETAEEELWEAIDWYDQQKKKLGREFAKSIEEFVAKIKTQPFLFPKIRENKRKAALKRFPYIIVFEIIGGKGFGAWSTGNITDEMVQEYLEHHRKSKDTTQENFLLE